MPDKTTRAFVVILDDREPTATAADIRAIADQLDGDRPVGGYEREDPETGAPLPAGVDGYRLGRRH